MSQEDSLHFPPRPSAPPLCWEASKLLAWMHPGAHNFATGMGRGLRKARMANELAEFDLLHRLRRGQPANLDQLVCAGMLLIASCKGAIPTQMLPLDEQLLINPQTFDNLLADVEGRLEELDLG